MKNLIVILGFGLVVLLSACERPINIGCISPEGSIEEQVADFNSFDRIEIMGDADVVITEGATQEVVIVAAPNIIDRLIEDSRVTDEELILEINGCSKLNNGELTVNVTIPSLRSLSIKGDGTYTTNGIFENIDDLIIDVSGDGDIDLELGAFNRLSTRINGDAEIVCSGSVNLVDVNISGDGEINFLEMAANELDLDVQGDADCRLNIVERIDINTQGDGTIECIGTASLQEIDCSGDVVIRNGELFTEITNIDISGDGDVEVRISEELNVEVSGDANICYRGDGQVNVNSSGSGSIGPCN